MKVLNLNKLDVKSSKPRELRIDDVSYPIVEMTVDNFIATTKEAERLANENATLPEMVEASVAQIMRSVPTLPREALGGRTLEVVNTIAAFVRGDEIKEADEIEEAEGGEGDAGK